MHNGTKKQRSGFGPGKLINHLSRLLRPDAGVKAFLISLEKTGREEEANKEIQKEIGNAMLEAEYKKAKATMASHQYRNLC